MDNNEIELIGIDLDFAPANGKCTVFVTFHQEKEDICI